MATETAPQAGAPALPRWRRTPVRIAAALVLVVAGAIALLVASAAGGGGTSRGAVSAAAAARRYVAAIERGDASGAVAVSCTSFANRARADAGSGRDPGISFTLGPVHAQTAQLREQLRFADAVQHEQRTLDLAQQGGRWLVCGEH